VRAPAVSRLLFGPAPGEERGRLRDRRAVLGGLSLAGSRGMAVLLTLVTVPVTLPYLGPERFGLWMTISSAISLMTFTDLGLGNGLMTLVAEDDGREDQRAAARHASNAFFALFMLAAGLGLAFAAIAPQVPWGELFNVSSPRAADEAGPATAAMAACFLLLMPFTVVQKLQLGYQDGLTKGLWDAAGSFLSLVGTVVVVVAGGSLPLLVGVFAAGPLVATVANATLWFGRKRRDLRPHWALVRWKTSYELVRVGFLYMLLQLAAMVAFFSDALIVARILGPEAVADYSVAWKLFSVVSLTLSLALTPLWPAYSEAAARHDARWVRDTLRRSIRLTLIATIPTSLVLLLLGEPIIDLWSRSEVDPPFGLLAGLAAWTVLGSVGVALAMFMNALKIVRLQLVVAGVMAVANVALSIVLTHAIGIEGVVLGTLLSYSLLALLPLGLALPRILRRLDDKAMDAARHAAPAALSAELPASNT
jgi:O-antigen/teichoic acid export membrane protein